MRRRQNSRLSTLALALTGGALMFASAGPVLAEGDPPGRGGHTHHAEQGWFMINGHRCAFEIRGSVEFSLLCAIKQAGHHAWMSDGCVVISGRGVRFTADLPGYTFTISKRGYRTTVRASRCDRGPDRRRSGGDHDRRWDQRDDCAPRSRQNILPHRGWHTGWHRDGRRDWRRDRRRGSNCELGFGVRIGGGRLIVRVPCD